LISREQDSADGIIPHEANFAAYGVECIEQGRQRAETNPARSQSIVDEVVDTSANQVPAFVAAPLIENRVEVGDVACNHIAHCTAIRLNEA
jgi:hypothetical protein